MRPIRVIRVIRGYFFVGLTSVLPNRYCKFCREVWAAWCAPCRAIAPTVDAIAEEYKGRVKVGKMDVDANGSTPARFNVRGIPTLLVFKDGQVKEQIVGAVDKSVIVKALDKHL